MTKVTKVFIGKNPYEKAETEEWIYPIMSFDQPESDEEAAKRTEGIRYVNAEIRGTAVHEMTI